MKITRKNIWGFKQNKPTLIVKDLIGVVKPNIVYKILLKRGVFKWFAVRRKLIKCKNIWKEEIKKTNEAKIEAKLNGNYKLYCELKGYQKALEHCRKDIRKLCHSDRFVAPDFDYDARTFLEKLEQEN